jgi:hypothetical protein
MSYTACQRSEVFQVCFRYRGCSHDLWHCCSNPRLHHICSIDVHRFVRGTHGLLNHPEGIARFIGRVGLKVGLTMGSSSSDSSLQFLFLLDVETVRVPGPAACIFRQTR